jgi:class 3 adenylate cyclase
VLIAQIVRDEIEDQMGYLQFASGGKLALKGFDQPVDVYEVLWDKPSPTGG